MTCSGSSELRASGLRTQFCPGSLCIADVVPFDRLFNSTYLHACDYTIDDLELREKLT